MNTKRIVRTVTLLFVITAGSMASEVQAPTTMAQAASESWLTLVDQQRYAERWRAVAAFFKNAAPAEKRQEVAKTARVPLGPLKSRGVKSASPAKTLPRAPDGDYVVVQFNTSFEHKAMALETVTARM